MAVRIHAAGRVCVEADGSVIDESRLPGRQGRVLLAMLAVERRRLSCDEIAEELWGDAIPRSWQGSLRSLASKLRAALSTVGVGGLSAERGAYELRLPGAWVDVLAAPVALHDAESAQRATDGGSAIGWALAAAAIARRPFLLGHDGPWSSRVRDQLREVHVRALELLAVIWIGRGDAGLAARNASEAVQVAPFRESAHRLLMSAHAVAGNRAEAVAAYERCRKLLSNELGVEPDGSTQDVYLAIVRAGR